MYSRRLETPLGEMLAVVGAEGALRRLEFLGRGRMEEQESDPSRFERLLRQLAEYFEGARREFDLALAPDGTSFQKAVWSELCRIPFGARISYGELARRLGRPDAARAVGAANGANPIAIVVPCHRVVGSDGSLTGYGGGLPIKRWLLDHEAGLRRLPVAGAAGPAI
jgi:methylated-DNA-[protein]-cysteine S-methyltransferase